MSHKLTILWDEAHQDLMFGEISSTEYSLYFGVAVLSTIMQEYGMKESEYSLDAIAAKQFYPPEPIPDYYHAEQIDDQEDLDMGEFEE